MAVPARRLPSQPATVNDRRATSRSLPVRVAAPALIQPVGAPRLTVVRRRRTARIVTFAAVLLIGLMLASAALSTQLAPREVQLDQLDQELREAREEYGRQRRLRAELRSPDRLVAEATALGMRPAEVTEFVEVTADIIALIQQSTGATSVDVDNGDDIDNLGDVKAAEQGAP